MASMAGNKAILSMLHLLYNAALRIHGAVTSDTKSIFCPMSIDKYDKRRGTVLRMNKAPREKLQLPNGLGIERQRPPIVAIQTSLAERPIGTRGLILRGRTGMMTSARCARDYLTTLWARDPAAYMHTNQFLQALDTNNHRLTSAQRQSLGLEPFHTWSLTIKLLTNCTRLAL